jgi:hypothetical protein
VLLHERLDLAVRHRFHVGPFPKGYSLVCGPTTPIAGPARWLTETVLIEGVLKAVMRSDGAY